MRLNNRSYVVFLIASTLICIPLAFYYQIASRIVEMSNLPIGQPMGYGQWAEIIFMFVMPFFFKRLGVKWMLAIGMLAWVARYALFSIGAPDEIRWMIIGGIVLYEGRIAEMKTGEGKTIVGPLSSYLSVLEGLQVGGPWRTGRERLEVLE